MSQRDYAIKELKKAIKAIEKCIQADIQKGEPEIEVVNKYAGILSAWKDLLKEQEEMEDY
mgnify:CR=1 FL=1|jgi:lipopolysaccharide biosynthesis regulator YciM